MKTCLNQDTLRTTPTETFLRIARKAEFDAIELTMDKVEPIIKTNGVKKLRRGIEDQGLSVASINGPENFNLLGEAEFSVIIDRTLSLASAAREIGCRLLVPVPSLLKGSTPSGDVANQTAHALSRLADECGEDINLGLEFLGMRNCSVNNLQTAVEVLRRVDKRNVRLVLDSFHLHLSGSDFSDVEKLAKGKVFLVHVNDSEPGDVRKLTDANRLYPGEGVIDLHRFGTTLRRIGYEGFLSLELLRPAYWQQDPEEVARTGRRTLKSTFRI